MTLTRINKDYYPTDSAITHKLGELDLFFPDTKILEPCYGEGFMALELEKLRNVCEVVGTDINGFCSPELALPLSNLTSLDATLPVYWQEIEHYYGSANWVITNPPFNKAFDILTQAYDHATNGVAMILRLSFLEPTVQRGEWLEKHADNMRYLAIFGQPRPSYRTDTKATDSVTTAWMVWDKYWSWKDDMGVDSPFKFMFNWK
jgi:hypothetical protein